MAKQYIKIVALLLAASILLCGCSGVDFEQLMGLMSAQLATPFSDMEYVRPDMDKMRTMLEACCQQAKTETDADALVAKALEFYGAYNSFYTQYNLATIYYFKDLTDIYWEKEYAFCQEKASVMEASLEELFVALAASPLREELEENPVFGEGFFESYMSGGVWDEGFSALMNQEAELENRYLELCVEAQGLSAYSETFFEKYSRPMGELFVELVAVRQEIAEYAGYEDYASFAYDFYYYRDYSPDAVAVYLQEIQRELVPLYRLVESRGIFAEENTFCRETDMLAYVESVAKDMGGTVQNAFALMKQAKLYDITYSERKYDGSFEIYLPDHYVPYVFVSPIGYQQDKLTFIHEFGHFCSDYAAGGSVAGVDVAEVFSQAMEYLSLCYGQEAGALEQMKIRDCLRVYVEQAAYAQFEQRVYKLKGDALTRENVEKLYEEVGLTYGFDAWQWDSRDYILIGHFFTDPMYIISYVLSNDAALQVYQMEKDAPGTGCDLLEKHLATEESQLLAFLKTAGLEGPMESGRLAAVRETLEEILMKNEGLLSSRSSFLIFVAPDISARRQYRRG